MEKEEDEDEEVANPSEELSKLYDKKNSIEHSLATLERQIYALETSYLEDTLNVGNLLKGWDGYLTGRNAVNVHKRKFKDEDRLFSLSSATAIKNNSEEMEKPIKSEKAYKSTKKDKKTPVRYTRKSESYRRRNRDQVEEDSESEE